MITELFKIGAEIADENEVEKLAKAVDQILIKLSPHMELSTDLVLSDEAVELAEPMFIEAAEKFGTTPEKLVATFFFTGMILLKVATDAAESKEDNECLN